mgnify:CR=1 FL=1
MESELNMTDEEPDWEELGDDWVNRFMDIISRTSLNRKDMLEILNEPWTVGEYMDAVANLGSPADQTIAGFSGIAGWKRMELVNSLVIEFLKTGTIESDWY